MRKFSEHYRSSAFAFDTMKLSSFLLSMHRTQFSSLFSNECPSLSFFTINVSVRMSFVSFDSLCANTIFEGFIYPPFLYRTFIFIRFILFICLLAMHVLYNRRERIRSSDKKRKQL